jgi:D-serine deaminase-like pyridoxal phosphate-dependent protein
MLVIGQPVEALETPALVIDLDRVMANIERMAKKARDAGALLRPHTKTHKMPALAHMQLSAGAAGITVATVGEAEVMSEAGIKDIFIANQVVSTPKVQKLKYLARKVQIRVGVDHPAQASLLSNAFQGEAKPIEVLIEVDTGERRSGVLPGEEVQDLVRTVMSLQGLSLKGIYTHEGHLQRLQSLDEMIATNLKVQKSIIQTKEAVERLMGSSCIVSAGSTPSLQGGGPVLSGIDELRPGTYIFNDASQSMLIGHYDWCAAFVMATVTNIPDKDHLVLNAGVRALSSDRRGIGVLHTEGYGYVAGFPKAHIARLSEVHAEVEGVRTEEFHIGQVLRIIPNHICTVTNLFDHVFVSRDGVVENSWTVHGRGAI